MYLIFLPLRWDVHISFRQNIGRNYLDHRAAKSVYVTQNHDVSEQHYLKSELWKVMGSGSAAIRRYHKRAQRSQLITQTLLASVTAEDLEVS